MNKINFNLEKWIALSPGLLNKKEWLLWSENEKKWPDLLTAPPVNLIKPMMRRRMSSLSKLALQCALQVSDQQQIDYIVFSSRHGELRRTVKLIEDIIQGDDASPMAFSQSVHNTAAGLFTISSKRAVPVTSIASADNSLHSAFIEACIYLQENTGNKVLVVDFDEPLPAPYECYEEQNHQGYALALLLSSGNQFQLSCSRCLQQTESQYPQAFEFIDYLLKDKKETQISGKRFDCSWKKL